MAGELRAPDRTEAAPLRSGFRPALDGARGIAILLVLLDHIVQTPAWHVGPHGVTLFFALSGYLITGLLVDEHSATGTVSLVRFYLRRAARLLPALLLVVLVCDAAFVALGDFDSVKASIATLAYAANYAMAAIGEYLFGYGHAWSLAVEEHFYAIWPLVLIVMMRRLSLRSALRWTLVACVASLAWRCVLLTFDGYSWQWFLLDHGTVARADALLYGCAAALAVRLGWRPRAWMVWPALGLVGWQIVAPWPDDLAATLGQATLSIACAVLLTCLDYTPSPVTRLLSLRPLVWLGAISYGLYLWHYPLLWISYDLGYQGVGVRAVVGGVLSIAVAAISFRYVERPLRAAIRAREQLVMTAWRARRVTAS